MDDPTGVIETFSVFKSNQWRLWVARSLTLQQRLDVDGLVRSKLGGRLDPAKERMKHVKVRRCANRQHRNRNQVLRFRRWGVYRWSRLC